MGDMGGGMGGWGRMGWEGFGMDSSYVDLRASNSRDAFRKWPIGASLSRRPSMQDSGIQDKSSLHVIPFFRAVYLLPQQMCTRDMCIFSFPLENPPKVLQRIYSEATSYFQNLHPLDLRLLHPFDLVAEQEPSRSSISSSLSPPRRPRR